jgi:hypothetical protein
MRQKSQPENVNNMTDHELALAMISPSLRPELSNLKNLLGINYTINNLKATITWVFL